MFSIEHTLGQFTAALLIGKPVVTNTQGEWGIEYAWRRCLHQIFGREAARLVQIAQTFCALLDSLESTPVNFPVKPQDVISQQKDFKAYIKAAEAILALLSTHDAPFAASAYEDLKMRTLALKYRMEAVNGGLNPQSPRFDLQKAFSTRALAWKDTIEIVHEKHLKESEILAIEELCRFREFAELLLKNEDECIAFFNWSIRDQISPALFVQFPHLRRKIVLHSMNGRIGRMNGNKVLKICKQPLTKDTLEKVVTLPFEGKDLNILNDKLLVHFRGNYTLSIAQVFEIFRDKYLRVGNIEFMKEGIINWNVQKWGWWDASENKYVTLDLSQNAWWKHFPLFETISLQQAKERYGTKADGTQWIAAATATRGRASLDVDLTHAYLEVAIPMDPQHYAIFDFGKLANEFPATFIDTLAMVCNTVHATIAYPDENVFYTHRQHAQHAFTMTPEEGFKLMESIRRDMISSRGLNFVYQVESENCAKWVHEKLESAVGSHALPNMFVMSIFQTEPLSFLRPIINFCKIFPESWQIKALTFFHLPLGASKGHWVLEQGRLVWRALTHHSFWKTGTIYLPCLLHKQKELGNLRTEKNILRNIFEADGVPPNRREETSMVIKNVEKTATGYQTFLLSVSDLLSITYERLVSRVFTLGFPWEAPPLIRFQN